MEATHDIRCNRCRDWGIGCRRLLFRIHLLATLLRLGRLGGSHRRRRYGSSRAADFLVALAKLFRNQFVAGPTCLGVCTEFFFLRLPIRADTTELDGEAIAFEVDNPKFVGGT